MTVAPLYEVLLRNGKPYKLYYSGTGKTKTVNAKFSPFGAQTAKLISLA
jgi:hypothetical protein